jgi:DNA polymerase-3 subunit gamma/tau
VDNIPWTLKYRPHSFTEVTGQRAPRLVLRRMVDKGDVRPALLFHGSHGSGKTSMARILAAALNCEAEEPTARPCGGCAVCVSTAEGRASDVTEIDAASSGLASDMRALREAVRFAASARYRVVILDECHSMSSTGFQTLLKTLEEPPANTIFVLVTTHPDKVPDNIKSRCLSLEFRRLTDNQIANRLTQIAEAEDLPLSSELAFAIATRCKGIARDSVSLLEQCVLVNVKTPEQLAVLLGDSDHGLAILRPLTHMSLQGNNPSPLSSDYSEAFAATERALSVLPSPQEVTGAIVRTLRRVLCLTTAGETVTLNPPASPGELSLAGQLDTARCVTAMRVVWEYYAKVAPAADAYAAMDLLVTLLGQALSTKSARKAA